MLSYIYGRQSWLQEKKKKKKVYGTPTVKDANG